MDPALKALRNPRHGLPFNLGETEKNQIKKLEKAPSESDLLSSTGMT